MDKPIHVLQVLGGLEAGGAESFVINLYRAIDREHVQFDFVKHIEHTGVFEQEIAQMGGKIYRCPQYNGKDHFAYCKWWNDFFTEYPEYHVIHGHVRSTASIYLKIAKKHGLVTIAHSHSTSNGSGFSGFVKNTMQLPIRHIADYLFACSDKAGIWLYGKKALTQQNYRTIPNGIDLKRFAFNAEKRHQMRKELGIAESTFIVGHVGRITTPKNHKFLIDLFAEYYKKNSDSKLLLVGDGELHEVVERQCILLGVRDAVIMTGSKANTEDYYQVMDVFVFPSLWEGLGIVAIEAQASGLPCLVSDNVPHEALLCSYVEALSLQDMSEWVVGLDKAYSCTRVAELDNLDPYDIRKIAEWFQFFYLEQDKKAVL